MIEIVNLSKQYKRAKYKSLENIFLSIDTGTFGLLGNNGAGKTTLMNILATLSLPSSGQVIINGIDLIPSNFVSIRKIIGYMPQENEVYDDITVDEAMEYFSILNKIASNKRKKNSQDILEYVNLASEKGKKYKELSGGMKRRLSLALTLINNPLIIIADEPTTGVDPYERIRMRELLLNLSQTKTVIVSTHIIEDISYMCHKLAVLNAGKLYFNGELDSILKYASGKIWTCKTTEIKEVEYIRSKYMVLGLTVNSKETLIRIYSQKEPDIQALAAEPTLEDAYIVLGKEQIGHENNFIFGY